MLSTLKPLETKIIKDGLQPVMEFITDDLGPSCRSDSAGSFAKRVFLGQDILDLCFQFGKHAFDRFTRGHLTGKTKRSVGGDRCGCLLQFGPLLSKLFLLKRCGQLIFPLIGFTSLGLSGPGAPVASQSS